MSKQCPNCGTTNADQSKFCTSCGKNIKSVNTSKSNSSRSQRSGNECLWCHQNAGYKEEEGKLDSKWGVTAHKVQLYICNNCGFVHSFGLGRTIFDFD